MKENIDTVIAIIILSSFGGLAVYLLACLHVPVFVIGFAVFAAFLLDQEWNDMAQRARMARWWRGTRR